MIIKASDILRRQGTLLIPTLGGITISGFGKVSMHEPTGVVFIEQIVDNNFNKFIVGVFSEQSIILEEREFVENTEQNFFDAVKYFEELIQKMSPPEQQELPSLGKFYFFKESLRKDCYVEIPGMPRVTIQRMDIPAVFTPPQTKPYGRLNMTDIPKPEYEAISSKFALRYNEEATKDDTDYQAGFYNLSDFAVYDMTPYDNKESEPGDESPEDVNDNKLTPDDIEGEDMNDKQNKEEQEQERQQEKNQRKDKGEKQDESEDEGGDEGERKDEQQFDEEGEPTDEEREPTDEEGEPTDEEGEPTDEESDRVVLQRGEREGEFELTDEKVVTPSHVTPSQIIPLLENTFDAKQGLKDKFRKQSFLLSSLNSYSQQELKTLFYDRLNIPENYPKADFIKLVSDNTQSIF
jgi:hypothetical protein